MSWLFVTLIDEIPPLGARVLRIDGQRIALFRTSKNQVFALRDVCPHKGGPLSQGIVHGNCVTCPLHDWVIDLGSGRAQGPDEGETATFDVRIDGDRVYLALPEAGPGPDAGTEALAARA